MKKPTAKHPHTPSEPRQPGHLQETLTEITTTTAVSLKRWRNPLIAALVVIVAIVIIYSVASAVRESKVQDINRELFLLFDGPGAQVEGYVPDKQKVDEILSAVRGSLTEKTTLKRIVGFYLGQADKLESKRLEESAKPDEKAEGTRGRPQKSAWAERPEAERALYTRALEIAEAAAQRITDDMDLQVWANGVKEKVAGELKSGWLPEPRKFSPLPPRAQPPAASGGAPSPGAAAPGEVKSPVTPEAGAAASPPAAVPADAPPPVSPESAGSK